MTTSYRYILLMALVAHCALAVERAQWMPTTRDIVGTGDVARANGVADWHIQIQSAALGADTPVSWRVRGGLWYSMVDMGQWSYPYNRAIISWDSLLNVQRSGATYDLHFEPLLAWPGDIFEIDAILPSGRMLTWKAMSDGAQWWPGATWLGQGLRDRVGPEKSAPDGIRDWEINIDHPFAAGMPARVDVWLPYSPIGNRLRRAGCFDSWSTAEHAAPVALDTGGAGLTVCINPVLATGGDEFFVRVVKKDARWALWKVIGMGADWEAGGEWFGQDERDFVGMFEDDKPNGVRDWHLRVASPLLTSPVRWVVRGAKNVWESRPPGARQTDFSRRALYADVRGNVADLYFDPVMERAGDVFYVSAVLTDGRLLNWGVVSLHQLRADTIAWRGQQRGPGNNELPVQGVSILPWRIDAQHEKLAQNKPYRWRITAAGKTWLFPRETDEDHVAAEPLAISDGTRPDTTALYLEPFFVKPGTEFNVEAVLTDGTLIQWTALADGAEWARAAVWRESDGTDVVGLTSKSGPDQRPDWILEIADDMLQNGAAAVSVEGYGWRWQWPVVDEHVSPLHLERNGTRATLYATPVPGKENDPGVLTVKTVFRDGIVRYWQAVRPLVETR